MPLPSEITVRAPVDFHVHFRGTELMPFVVPFTARHFAAALVMPNVPVVETGPQAFDYRKAVMEHVPYPRNVEEGRFQVLSTIKLTHRTTPETIQQARACGVVAAKLYPQGATTGSHDGITDPWCGQLRAVYEAMLDCGMVLCIHAEEPDPDLDLDEMEDEYRTLVVLPLATRYPDLKIVMEHISTLQSVNAIKQGPSNLAATITAHHLTQRLNDVGAPPGLRPHNFCWPILKGRRDLAVLQLAALQGGPRFFFGSDSAPHVRGNKEAACGCAGVFSAPAALAVLAGLFFADDGPVPLAAKVAAFEAFTSGNGCAFYGIDPPEGTITLVRDPWEVPLELPGNLVPWRAGETLPWRVLDRA